MKGIVQYDYTCMNSTQIYKIQILNLISYVK